MDGVAEDVAEGADPYDLVDESAYSGREEREVNQLATTFTEVDDHDTPRHRGTEASDPQCLGASPLDRSSGRPEARRRAVCRGHVNPGGLWDQNWNLNPNCTVRAAYDRLGLATGCPNVPLVSVRLYAPKLSWLNRLNTSAKPVIDALPASRIRC